MQLLRCSGYGSGRVCPGGTDLEADARLPATESRFRGLRHRNSALLDNDHSEIEDYRCQSWSSATGYESAERFISPGGLRQDVAHTYSLPKHLELNQWGFSGSWTDRAEVASLGSASGRIVYRFHARDLHLVLGPGPNGEPVRYRVTIDGVAPGGNHGVDTDPQGKGTITEHRLYQLIRQKDGVEDRTFEIEFLDPGAQAFAFTFG